MVHQLLSAVGSTYWVQRQNTTTALSGTTVTINDTAPTADKTDLAIVEILPTLTAAADFTIAGTPASQVRALPQAAAPAIPPQLPHSTASPVRWRSR